MGCRPDELYYNNIIEGYYCNGQPVDERLVELAELVVTFIEKLHLPKEHIYNKFKQQYEALEYILERHKKLSIQSLAIGFVAYNSKEDVRNLAKQLGLAPSIVRNYKKKYEEFLEKSLPIAPQGF